MDTINLLGPQIAIIQSNKNRKLIAVNDYPLYFLSGMLKNKIIIHPNIGRARIVMKSGVLFLKPLTQKGWVAAYQMTKYSDIYYGLADGRRMPLFNSMEL
jgi:hypothetical protein